MPNLPETANQFDAGVYQLETNDPVVGGAAGTSNKQAIALANRTAFLKAAIDAVIAGEGGLPDNTDPTLLYAAIQSAIQSAIGAGTITTAINAHIAANDPHAQYTTNAEVLKLIAANVPIPPTAPVQSVAGKKGAVVITKADVGLANVSNTSDMSKPISTAQNAKFNAEYLRTQMPQGLRRKSTYLGTDYNFSLWRDGLEDGHYDVYLSVAQNGLPRGYWYIDVQRHYNDIPSNNWRTIRAIGFGAGNKANEIYQSTCALGTWTPFEKIAKHSAGEIFAFAGAAIPSGSIICNGAAISRSTYAALFAVIGTTFGAGNNTTTFNLPDLRGEFIRGLDAGRGIDVGRVLGSWQPDVIKSHTHTVNGFALTMPGNQIPWYNWGNRAMANNSPTTTATGGTETRPRNVAMNYCIKY